jgi:hypothetical protein
VVTSNVRTTINVPLLLWFLWITGESSSIQVIASWPLAVRNAQMPTVRQQEFATIYKLKESKIGSVFIAPKIFEVLSPRRMCE